MQPVSLLKKWLDKHGSKERYLFTLKDLRSLFPDLGDSAFKTLISRACKSHVIDRVCRGIYLNPKVAPYDGHLLFHVAALLRTDAFNYISLETVLSDAGVISQIPLSTVSIMSSGRSNTIKCYPSGIIEFVHTNKKPQTVKDQLTYDTTRRMWRASVGQAIRDMKATNRNCDLIDWEIANELI